MQNPQSEKGSETKEVVSSFSCCLIFVLYSIIPVLTILAGVLTAANGLVFWGIAIIVLGVMALIGPFYAAATRRQ